MKYTTIPIANCPKCGRPLFYSKNPKERRNIFLRVADDDYSGRSVLCAKCKTMLAVIEKPKEEPGYIIVPVYNRVPLQNREPKET